MKIFQNHNFEKKLSNSNKAFTLIELLVVIAIISLLVSILLPSLNKAKDLARKVACMSNLRTIGTTIALYTGQYDGAMPLAFERHWSSSTVDGLAGDGKGYWWTGLLYSSDNGLDMNIFSCPSDERKLDITEESLYVPVGDTSPEVSYGGVCIGYNGTTIRVPWSLPGSSDGILNVSDIINAGDVNLVWDYGFSVYSWGNGTANIILADMLTPDYWYVYKNVFRHGDGGYEDGPNALMFDGHVEGTIDVYELKDENLGNVN